VRKKVPLSSPVGTQPETKRRGVGAPLSQQTHKRELIHMRFSTDSTSPHQIRQSPISKYFLSWAILGEMRVEGVVSLVRAVCFHLWEPISSMYTKYEVQ
jgi:hypothetical protein